jgi:hypothetical protein
MRRSRPSAAKSNVSASATCSASRSGENSAASAAARSRSISMTVSRSTFASSGRVSAPSPGPISTRRSPRFGAIASTMRSM